MPTPHISAPDGAFAPDILLPGDPRRATRIAETFLDGPELVTDVRGILGYTGTYEGRPMSVMATGMGMPSATIYATELIRHYGVKRLVRVGTAGGIHPDLQLGDVIAASAAHTDSSMTAHRLPGVHYSHAPSFALLRAAADHADEAGAPLRVGPVLTSDAFYHPDPTLVPRLAAYGTLAVEMEAAGLYAVAAAEGVEALMIATVSDHVVRGEELDSEQRETTFKAMVSVALGALTR
ncbi:purine-nucleoside phosphorylase [Demequina sp. NBRC 110057]|uniref:purine-nucleoside phosphorylase n=1 Tax=Demequina sp. NBRC 110057 TaxID=1570346 RepID=UPI000A0562D6|nr:purine-nucleoside phosphorylase [Demequina sp. NBRC 110057]